MERSLCMYSSHCRPRRSGQKLEVAVFALEAGSAAGVKVPLDTQTPCADLSVGTRCSCALQTAETPVESGTRPREHY